MARTKLFTNFERLEYFKQKEDQAKANLKELEDNFHSITDVESINYKELFENTKEYILSSWWNEAKQFYPKNSKRDFLFSTHVHIPMQSFLRLVSDFKNNCKQLMQYKPTIDNDAVKWNVSQDKFNKYLDESKKDHYKALLNFLEASERLREFEPHNGHIHLVRYSQNLISKNGKAEIQLYNFTE